MENWNFSPERKVWMENLACSSSIVVGEWLVEGGGRASIPCTLNGILQPPKIILFQTDATTDRERIWDRTPSFSDSGGSVQCSFIRSPAHQSRSGQRGLVH